MVDAKEEPQTNDAIKDAVQEHMQEQHDKEKLVDEGTKMLKGRSVDNALLENIQKKGSNSYYYAHAPKDFTTEGAQHFKGDGKIYGGDPVLIKSYSVEEAEAARAREAERAAKPKKKEIGKFSWEDEAAKVKIRIDFAQFDGPIVDDAVDVKFSDYSVEVNITDAKGVINQKVFSK